MRVLFVSDIHYSLKQFDWLCAASAGFDLLIIGGDLLDLAGHADVDTQTVVVRKYLQKLGASLPVAVCSGNHDLDVPSGESERRAEWLSHLGLDRVSVDFQSLTSGDCRFSICSWWDGPQSQAEVAEFLAQESRKERPRYWIWVYHSPPDGAKTSWNGKDCTGDAFLSDRIREHRPDIVLSGHFHNSPFRKGGQWFDRIGGTWVFNPGRQPSSIPSTIVLDLGAMEATWESEMDTQTIRLAEAPQV